jgi:hypothetical protein
MVATAMAALEKAWHIFPPGGNIGLHLFQVLRVPLSLRPLSHKSARGLAMTNPQTK